MTHTTVIRITHLGKFYPPHYGGIENYVHNICQATKDDFSLEVIVSNDFARTEFSITEGVPVKRLATYGLLASTPLSPGFVKEVRSIHEGIVHLHHPNPIPMTFLMFNRDRRIRIVVSYHSDIVKQRFLKLAFEPVLHSILRRSSAIIVGSPNLIEHSRILKDYREKCEVIPYPIDIQSFRASISREKVAALRKQTNKPIVLSVGRLVSYKGFSYLIAAMKNVDAELWIVGEGPLRDQLEQQALRNGQNIRLLGNVDDIQNYHAAADLFVLPSINQSEAYGIVQMEAMASGKAVVNTDLLSGVPYVSRSGETGITVPPCSSEALREAILALLSNRELREQMGRNAAKRVESEFDIKVIRQRTSALYQRVAARDADTADIRPAGEQRRPRYKVKEPSSGA